MLASVNRVILLGTIGKYGVEIRYAATGTPKATFSLELTEAGADGQQYRSWFDCEVWGKKAEAAGELEAGQVVVFEGRLRKVKKGEAWETVVSGFEVHPVHLAVTTGVA